MKFALLSILAVLAPFAQAEVLDISPIISIMADAPVLGLLLFLFMRQMNHHERITKALLTALRDKSQTDDDE